MEYHELVVARSCSVARVGRAELLELGGNVERWHGRVSVARCGRAETLPGTVKIAGWGLYLRMCLALCLGKFGGNTRPRRNLALIPNMMYLQGEEQW